MSDDPFAHVPILPKPSSHGLRPPPGEEGASGPVTARFGTGPLDKSYWDAEKAKRIPGFLTDKQKEPLDMTPAVPKTSHKPLIISSILTLGVVSLLMVQMNGNIQGSISSLRDEFHAAQSKRIVESNVTAPAQVAAAPDDTEALSDIHGAIKSLGNRFDTIESKVDKLSAKVDSVQTGVTNTYKGLTAMEAKMKALATLKQVQQAQTRPHAEVPIYRNRQGW